MATTSSKYNFGQITSELTFNPTLTQYKSDSFTSGSCGSIGVPSRPDGVVGVTGIDTFKMVEDNSPIKQIEYVNNELVTIQNTLSVHQDHEVIDDIFINSPNIDIYGQNESELIFYSDYGKEISNDDSLSKVHKLPSGKYGIISYSYVNNPYYTVTSYTYNGETKQWESVTQYGECILDENNNGDLEFFGTYNGIISDNTLTINKLVRQLQSTKNYSYNFWDPINDSYTNYRYLGPVIQKTGNSKFGNNIPKYNNVTSFEKLFHSYTDITYIGNVVSYDNRYWTVIDNYDDNKLNVVPFDSLYNLYYSKEYPALLNTGSLILLLEENSYSYIYGVLDESSYKLTVYSYGSQYENGTDGEETIYGKLNTLSELTLTNTKPYIVTKFEDDSIRYSYTTGYNLTGYNYDENKSKANIWFTFSYLLKDDYYNDVKCFSSTYNYKIYDKIQEKEITKTCDFVEIIVQDDNGDEIYLSYSLLNDKSNKSSYLSKSSKQFYNTYVIDTSYEQSSITFDYDTLKVESSFGEYQFPVLSTYSKTVTEFNNGVPSYEYIVQELIENQEMLSTYWIYNSILDEYILFEKENNKSIIYYEGDYYGIVSNELCYTYTVQSSETSYYTYSFVLDNYANLSIESVVKRSKFNTEVNPGTFIPSASNNITVDNHIPFYLSNLVEKIPLNDYELHSHKYSYVIKQLRIVDPNTEGEEKTYLADTYNYKIEPIIIQDEYWTQKYEEIEKPLLVESSTTLTHPLTIGEANILSGVKNNILGYVIHPLLTYKDYVITYNKTINYGYYDTYNLFHQFTDTTYDVNGITYGILSIPETKDENGKTVPEHQKLITLSKYTTVKREQVLEDLIYQFEYIEPIVSPHESSWGMINGEKLVIDEEIYMPPTYVDIKTVNPITGEYEVHHEIATSAYTAYRYHYESIPFITSSYVYQQGAITVNNMVDLISSINNSQTIISSGANSISSNIANVNSIIAEAANSISSSISGNYVGNIISNELNQARSLTSSLFNNLLSNLNNNSSQVTQIIEEALSNLSNGINKSIKTIVNSNEDLQDNLLSKNEKNISNLIDSLKKQLGNINSSITTLSSAMTSSQSSLNNVLSELASKPDTPSTTYINIEADENGYVPQINLGGSSNTNGEKIKNYNSVREIGKIEPKIVEVEKTISTSIPGAKLPLRKTEKKKEIQKVVDLYNNPKERKITYVNTNNETIHGVTSQIGLHKKISKQNIAYNDKVYELEYTTYEGIADILSEISRRIPTKQEFIIDVAKQLYINTAFDIETSYKSPSDHAKTAIQRATIMWTELEKTKFVKPTEKDNTLAYSLIEAYK